MRRQIKKLLPTPQAFPDAPAKLLVRWVLRLRTTNVEWDVTAGSSAPPRHRHRTRASCFTAIVDEGLRFNGGKRWQTVCEQSVNYPNSQPTKFSGPPAVWQEGSSTRGRAPAGSGRRW